jgi:hypothetical protein
MSSNIELNPQSNNENRPKIVKIYSKSSLRMILVPAAGTPGGGILFSWKKLVNPGFTT